MKRAQLIGIGVAGSAGILAFMMIQGLIKKPAVETVEVQVKSSDVLVARADISLGGIAGESVLRWQSWPDETITPEFITRTKSPEAITELTGAVARQPVLAGEPVTTQKLVRAGQGGILAAILPRGMRAISTKIREETAAGRLILPNDRVDVILTRRVPGKNGSDDFSSDTLFENVRVLAVGQTIESKEGRKVAEGNANTATLELTARQSERLALANMMGEISLSLRSISDLERDAGPTAGSALDKAKDTSSVRVLRYGVRSQASGVN